MVQLESERLILRKITLDDAPYTLAQLNDPGWIKYIGDRNIHTIEAAKDYIQNKILSTEASDNGNFFVVIRKDDTAKKIIGQCGLFKREGLEYKDLGFAFLADYCGQGYGSEAASVVLDYARETLKLKNICAITTEDNIRSRRLLEKLGFKYRDTILLPNIEGLSSYYEI